MLKRYFALAAMLSVVTACDSITSSNGEPVAAAGDDQAVFVGETVSLSAVGSTDPDGDALTYSWALTTKPDTSSATVSSAGSETATFVPDVPGTYVAQVTVSDGDDDDIDEVTVTASYDLRLSGTISADSTLHDRGAPYTVAASVVVGGGTLTIMPGVRIEFAQGARFIVSSGGVLKAIGTAADTIRFVGSQSTAGHWEGIEIASASPLNELTYVEIAHGGANSWAGLWVWSGAAVKVTHSLIRNSSTVGVENTGSLSGWAENVLRDNAVAGLDLAANTIRHLDAASVYAGGSTPYALKVTGSAVGTAGTWPKTDKPYLMAASPTLSAEIVVQPGVEMAFEQNQRLIVASGGSLKAAGLVADTIRMYGTQSTAGFWEGVEVSSASTTNELTYVEIADGGANSWAGLWVWSGANMKVTHSLIRNSATSGVENSGSLAGWSENTLRDNIVAGLEMTGETIRYLDAGSTYAAGSTPYAVKIAGSGAVNTAGTWPKTDKPYLVEVSPVLNAGLTIAPGASLWFTQDQRLIVASGGSLTAEGTVNDTITFRGVQEMAGFWEGIEVSSLSASNSLDYVTLGHGGRNSWANLWIWSGASMSVANSIIHDSATCGVEARGTYVATNVTYTNNATADVCN